MFDRLSLHPLVELQYPYITNDKIKKKKRKRMFKKKTIEFFKTSYFCHKLALKD